MAAVRSAADPLEGIVADALWPLPTYQEMLLHPLATSAGASFFA
jgi:glutamine synthetase type III